MSRVSVAQMVNTGESPVGKEQRSKRAAGKPAVFRTEHGPAPQIPVSLISPNPWQPRTEFSASALEALTQSVKESGIIQPLLVRSKDDGSFELVAGERRLRAAVAAGLDSVPVVVQDVPDEQMPVLALVENLQRDDLGPIEEAVAVAAVLSASGATQADLAKQLGVTRAFVAHAVALSRLPKPIQELIEDGALSRAHGKALAGLASTSPDVALSLAVRAAEENMTSSELEEAVKTAGVGDDATGSTPRQGRRGARHGRWHHVAAELKAALGAPVVIRSNDAGGGVITIRYANAAEFESVIGNLGVDVVGRQQPPERAGNS